MTHGRTALTLLTAALVAGPMFAQQSKVAPETFASIRAQEPQRVRQATDHIMGLRADLGLNGNHDLMAKSAGTDPMGFTHTHFQQHFLGVRVWQGDAITHMDRNGRFAPQTDALIRNISLNVTPSLSPKEAVAVANADLNPRGAYVASPSAELVIFPVMRLTPKLSRSRHTNADDFDHVAEQHLLAYHVHAELQNGADETIHRDYMIDAHSGAILKTWDDLHTTGAVGTGNSQFSGAVSLNTNLNGSTYELSDVVGNMPIKTYNLNHATSGTGTLYTDADNTWGDGNNYTGSTTSTTGATGQTAAVDAHYGIMMTSAYYKNVFGRNGIDGNGRATYSSVHYSTSYDNAFWSDTCFCMTYGDGSSFKSLESLDVAGHEMSHGVCANNGHGGLTYSGESGGINEADSDIMGTFVVFYTYGGGGTGSTVPNTISSANLHGYTPWTIGSQLSSTPLRYMYKPSLDGASPDAWSSTIGSKDVHYSSGPANRMIYFLSQGATTSGNTSTTYLPNGMTGIGNDHAARIWYRALTTYFTSGLTYAQCRTACLNAATDLYGASSAEYAAVENAFHGINVGNAHAGIAVSISPTTATVQTGATYQFTASVTGSTNTAVTWSTTGGSVSTSGLYTAPATAGTYTVKATSAADTTVSASATVTVTTAGSVSVSITPTTATVAAGATYQFSASVTGSTNTAVTWTTTGGTVSTAGLYTAPATAGTYTVKATSVADTTKSASATVTVTSTGTTYNEVESNGSISAANPVPDTATKIVGYIGTTTDLDYFKVLVGAGKTLTVNMTGPSGKDYDLYLYNASGTQLKSSLGSTATETVTYTNSGSSSAYYYIKVLGYNKAYSTTTSYNLALSR